MRASGFAVVALVAIALEASPVAAQDTQSVEVTPYLALGTAGASPVGVVFTFPVTGMTRWTCEPMPGGSSPLAFTVRSSFA